MMGLLRKLPKVRFPVIQFNSLHQPLLAVGFVPNADGREGQKRLFVAKG